MKKEDNRMMKTVSYLALQLQNSKKELINAVAPGLLFDREESNIRRHIINVFNEKELERENNVHFSHVNGVKKPVPYYSLDVIISVGYRMAYCTLPTVASASQTTPYAHNHLPHPPRGDFE